MSALSACTSFDMLLPDIQAYIFSFLSIRSVLCHVALVSKAWRNAIKHPIVWHRCSLSRFEMYDAQLHTLVQMWEDYDCSPESLSLTISDLSSQGLMLLSGLFTIRHLTLKRGFRIHALALQELLSYLPNLTSLKLVSCSLEDLTLPVMPMLNHLALMMCETRGMRGLDRQPELHHINVDDCADIEHVSLPTTITSAMVRHKSRAGPASPPPSSPPRFFTCLASCSQLSELESNVTSAIFNAVPPPSPPSLPNSVGRRESKYLYAPPLFPQLRVLRCQDPVHDAELSRYASQNQICELQFPCALTSRGMQMLGAMSSLVRLSMQGVRLSTITDNDIQHLTQLRSLEQLVPSHIRNVVRVFRANGGTACAGVTRV